MSEESVKRVGIEEAARRLGIAVITLRRKVARGEISCYRPSGAKCKILFTEADLWAFVERHTHRAKEASA